MFNEKSKFFFKLGRDVSLNSTSKTQEVHICNCFLRYLILHKKRRDGFGKYLHFPTVHKFHESNFRGKVTRTEQTINKDKSNTL